MPGISRRLTLVSVGAGFAMGALGVRAQANQAVRIGFQKSSTLTAVLKTQGTLERDLAPLGAKVSWHEFTSGLPLLEALNLDHIEFSADVADTVPVFAQAAGAQLTFVADEAPSPKAQAIVVRADSPLKSLSDLRGRKVGVAKGSGGHYLLLAALEKSGVPLREVDVAYLTPADARAAFEKGAIDAWVAWDPFFSAVQRQSGARVLADGTGIASYQRFYLASTRFAQARPDVLRAIYAALEKAGKWVKSNPREAAELLAPVWGLDVATVEQANARRSYEVRPVAPGSLGEQQRIADAFFAEKLLPRRVDTAQVALFQPGPGAR